MSLGSETRLAFAWRIDFCRFSGAHVTFCCVANSHWWVVSRDHGNVFSSTSNSIWFFFNCLMVMQLRSLRFASWYQKWKLYIWLDDALWVRGFFLMTWGRVLRTPTLTADGWVRVPQVLTAIRPRLSTLRERDQIFRHLWGNDFQRNERLI